VSAGLILALGVGEWRGRRGDPLVSLLCVSCPVYIPGMAYELAVCDGWSLGLSRSFKRSSVQCVGLSSDWSCWRRHVGSRVPVLHRLLEGGFDCGVVILAVSRGECRVRLRDGALLFCGGDLMANLAV